MKRAKNYLRNTMLLAGAGVLAAVPITSANQDGGHGAAFAKGRISAISAQEAAQGAQLHPQLLKEFGGAMSGPQASYVRSVGQKIAMQSGIGASQNAFTVTTLNSPVNNAFAIPGGYVYTTRQLVGLMNNEAELAAVLGHEVGHIAADHSKRRKKAARSRGLLGIAGAVLSGVFLGDTTLGNTLGNLALQGSQLATLSYSRGQEREADQLGIQYLKGAGYDPRAMATALQSLAMQNALDAQLQGRSGASVPAWASSHPNPASRVRSAHALAGNGGGELGRDRFIAGIDGLLYGDDPKQGMVDGNRFIHPDMGFAFTAPTGFQITNGSDAVQISGQSGKAQLTSDAYSGDLKTYVRQQFAQFGSQSRPVAPQAVNSTKINGFSGANGIARVKTRSGQLDVAVHAYEIAPGRVLQFITLAPAGKSGVFDSMTKSMRRVSKQEAANVTPRRIDVVTVRPGDSVASLSQRMAYENARPARFRVLNGMSRNDTVKPGQKVKLVVWAK